jgi:hypothetical protein
MNRAWKKPLLAPFGQPIPVRIDPHHPQTKKTLVLRYDFGFLKLPVI